MERAIKFRAFVKIDFWERILNEPQGTGSHYVSRDCMCEVLQLNLSTGNMRVRYKKGGTTDIPIQNLMQYTGLKDKNGKLIFEGDIVTAWSAGSKGVFEVRWRQEASPCWLLYPNFQHREHWSIHATEHNQSKQFIDVSGKISTSNKEGFYDEGLEVIGNIYENPELLKRD